jgi:lysophospholipase L1-like esterase
VTTLGVLGDSGSLGVSACGSPTPCPAASWVAGTMPEVDSIASRLQSTQGSRPKIVSAAQNGGTVADELARVGEVTDSNPQIVTILVGANDACATSVASMTSPADFSTRIDQLVTAVRSGAPHAQIVMLSIPNLGELWEIGHTNPEAVSTWERGNLCPSMLANPQSTDQVDATRRQTVVDRVTAFNTAIAEACKSDSRCVSDGGALNAYHFTANDISTVDFFHPSVAGQHVFANVAWNALKSAR